MSPLYAYVSTIYQRFICLIPFLTENDMINSFVQFYSFQSGSFAGIWLFQALLSDANDA